MILVICAGDSGVYVGRTPLGAGALGADGRVFLYCARHLRRYRVAGGEGSGSVSDLAVRGLAPDSPSVSDPVPGATVLLGVRRLLVVSEVAAPSFGVPK